jgi:PLP dependent protein
VVGVVNRRDDLARNLDAVRARIARACEAVDRDPETVTLIAVTKTWPVSDIRFLAELGVTNIGENRDQEAKPKAIACSDLDITWHFVGQVQTNKCRSIVSYAHIVQSVDRDRLVGALGQEATRAGRVVQCMVQVALDTGPGRAGVAPDRALCLADHVADTDGLELAGVMGMAPAQGSPADAFAQLEAVAARVRSRYPGATTISAGMTNDLEAAIAHGSTHVRIGTALLGT